VLASRLTRIARSYRVTIHPSSAASQDTGSVTRNRASSGCGSASSSAWVALRPIGNRSMANTPLSEADSVAQQAHPSTSPSWLGHLRAQIQRQRRQLLARLLGLAIQCGLPRTSPPHRNTVRAGLRRAAGWRRRSAPWNARRGDGARAPWELLQRGDRQRLVAPAHPNVDGANLRRRDARRCRESPRLISGGLP